MFSLRNTFAGNAALLSASTAVSQAVGLAALATAAAYVPVAEIGVYAVFLAYHTMIERVASLGYPTALPNLTDEDLPIAVGAIGGVVAVASLLSFAAFGLLNPSFSLPAAIGCLAGGAIRLQRMLRVREEAYPLLAAMVLGPNVGLLLAVAFGWALGLGGARYLIYAHVLSLAATALVCAVAAGDPVRWLRWRPDNVAAGVRFLVRHRSYPLMVAPAELCNAAALALPTILVQQWFPGGSALAAQYAVTRRIGFAPMGTIGQGISRVLHGRLAKGIRNADARYAATYHGLRRRLVVASLAAGAGFFLFGPTVVGLLLGEGWEMAGQFLRILSPAFAMTLLAAPLSVVFFACESHGVNLQSQLMILAASVASLALGAWIGDISVAVLCLSLLLSARFAWMVHQTDRVVAEQVQETNRRVAAEATAVPSAQAA